MALVAIVALGTGGERILSRLVEYQRLARYHGRMEARYWAELDACRDDPDVKVRIMARQSETLAGFHAARRAKYERAAWRPWLREEAGLDDEDNPYNRIRPTGPP